MKTVAIVGTFDSKGVEFQYFRDQVIKEGAETVMVDVGVLGEPAFNPDIRANEIASAGGMELTRLREKKDRAQSNEVMRKGAAIVVKKLYDEGKIDGVATMGGGQGSNIAAHVMRALPVGFPKVLLSTLATTKFVVPIFEGINDTMVMNTLVDVSGLNHILRSVIDKAASAIVGMVNNRVEEENEKPRIALSMLGITTPCVSRIQKRIDAANYETLVFHANGLGGKTMEKLIEQGEIQGVVDMTIYEVIANYRKVDGDAGPNRLEAAGKMGIPQIICPGAMDILNFAPPESMPEEYRDRKFIMHVNELKVARSSVEENQIMGERIAKKLNQAKGPVIVVLPLKGLSYNDMPEKEFYDAKANEALFKALKQNLNNHIPVIEKDYHINDPEFADAVADIFFDLVKPV